MSTLRSLTAVSAMLTAGAALAVPAAAAAVAPTAAPAAAATCQTVSYPSSMWARASNGDGTYLTRPTPAITTGTTTVAASAWAGSGIARVQFFADGCLIGTTTAAPFSVTWSTTAAVGSTVKLQSVVVDNAGYWSKSGLTAVTVTAAPTPTTPSPTATPTATATPNPTATPSTLAVPAAPVFDLSEPAGGYFGPGSVWKAPVATAPVNTNSAAMVSTLTSQVALGSGIAAVNVWNYNESMVTAPAGTAPVRVIWDNCQHKTYTPTQLYGVGGMFLNVPIPANAIPSKGTDAGLAVYSPSTDQLWSFWKAVHQSDGWHACWGGRIDHVSTALGFFANGTGASASGLASEGGAISIADAKSGSIDHAMSLAIPSPADWHQVSWPAQRSDGSPGSTSNIPEGTRFRLDPSIDVSTLNLTPIARMIAVAAQKYGFIVTDKAGAVSVTTEGGDNVAAATGTNPWTAILGSSKSYLLLKNFPWSSLQALPQNWGEPKS